MSIDLLIKEDFKPHGLSDVADRLRRKAAVTPAEFERLSEAQRRAAFTFSEVHKARVIQRLRDTIATALRNGTPYRDVRLEMLRVLKSVGVDSVPFHRLRFLYQHHATRTMAEAQTEFLRQGHLKSAFPYWHYLTVGSPGHRDTHEALVGVYSVDDPGWRYFDPPWEPG